MSAWTYVNGSIYVTSVGRTLAETRYILETILDHLPRVSGSERDMKVFIIPSDYGWGSQPWDEFDLQTDKANIRRGIDMETNENYMLWLKNVTVEFEKEHIRTDDPTSSFVFSLMSAIAENESQSISENVKWGQRERVKRGEYNLGNNRILGYDCVDGKLVPNKDADVVRLIYTLFLQGKSIEEIRRLLADIDVKTKKGTMISHNDILYILKNETYKGDKLLQKTHPKDLITKRPDPNVQFESNYLENDHEAIVSRDVWDAVAARLKKNNELAEVVGHRGGQPHLLYGKVFCECGAPIRQ